MPDDSTKRSRRQYRRRSPREILIDKKKKLESTLEKGRKRVDEDEKGLEQVESEIAEFDQKERTRTRDQQAPLIGLVFMHLMHEDPNRRANVAELLDRFLIRAEDRAVFGFKPLTRAARKQRSDINLHDVEPFTAEELRESRSASRRRPASRGSSERSDSPTGEKI